MSTVPASAELLRWVGIDTDRKYIEKGSTHWKQHMDDTRRTEVDGLRATWLLFQNHLISIVAVHGASGAPPIVSFGPEEFPDLAQARELHPELNTLWDAVRHEFWTKLIPPHPGCRHWRWT
ncbi:hypothetical protein [Nocardia sp. MDA0666]|uniref:hypothetical protein n=1 Tax=Nocardia sp. MDA0666 TaxID=2135448 RepID=UPI0011B2046F|nr:hypothetical protein [Nocardia sp. MDA0666]